MAATDCRNREETRAIYEKYKPKYVIHLAARVGGLFANMKYKVEFWRENVAINDNVIDLAYEFGVEKVRAGTCASRIAPHEHLRSLALSPTSVTRVQCRWSRACPRASSRTRPPTRSTRR